MSSIATRIEVAKSVGFPLIEAEKHLDAAFTLLAQVQAAAVEGRRAARLPLHTGHDALAQILAAQQTLMETRKAVHEAHNGFRAVQDKMAVGPISYGDHGDTPREEVPGLVPVAPGAHLSLAHAA